MSGKNKKRPRTDSDTDQRPSHGLRSAKRAPSSNHHPEHLSAFAAIRARQNASASDTRQLPERDGPSDGIGADDDWSDRGEGSEDAGAEARPAARSSLESWKTLLDARPDEGSVSELDAGERVRLKAGQKLCVAGQYYMRVLSGEVSVCCSHLGPESPAQRIVASSIEPLPVICSRTVGAEVEVSSVSEYEDFETLGGISPLFRGIWPSSGPRTYHIVRMS
jgi:hypothetical protein